MSLVRQRDKFYFPSVPANISENRHLPWFTKIRVKDVRLQILIGWTGRSGRMLNLAPPIGGKNLVARVLGVNAATCYICVKLKFGVAWVQKDPAKMTSSTPVKV
jgi:hypothetical protein